jgi:hypothetical protein
VSGLSTEGDLELGISPITFHPDDRRKSLNDAYEYAVQFARTKVRWYLSDAARNGNYARWIRGTTISLFAGGTICPLIDAARPSAQVRLAPWGFVLLALAAAEFLLDRSSGFSWRSTRSTIIWIALRQEYRVFQHDWVKAMTKSDATRLLDSLFERVRQFDERVLRIIASEAKDWAAMMDQARKELEADVRSAQKG